LKNQTYVAKLFGPDLVRRNICDLHINQERRAEYRASSGISRGGWGHPIDTGRHGCVARVHTKRLQANPGCGHSIDSPPPADSANHTRSRNISPITWWAKHLHWHSLSCQSNIGEQWEHHKT